VSPRHAKNCGTAVSRAAAGGQEGCLRMARAAEQGRTGPLTSGAMARPRRKASVSPRDLYLKGRLVRCAPAASRPAGDAEARLRVRRPGRPSSLMKSLGACRCGSSGAVGRADNRNQSFKAGPATAESARRRWRGPANHEDQFPEAAKGCRTPGRKGSPRASRAHWRRREG